MADSDSHSVHRLDESSLAESVDVFLPWSRAGCIGRSVLHTYRYRKGDNSRQDRDKTDPSNPGDPVERSKRRDQGCGYRCYNDEDYGTCAV